MSLTRVLGRPAKSEARLGLLMSPRASLLFFQVIVSMSVSQRRRGHEEPDAAFGHSLSSRSNKAQLRIRLREN
jgi:hypothetical protein